MGDNIQEMSFQNVIDTILKPKGITVGGYPDSLFIDLNDSDREKWQCNICYLVLRNPQQCDNKHKFCATCVFAWSMTYGANSDKCPVCRCKQPQYSKDVKLKLDISSKTVKCPEIGCTLRCPLSDFLKHSHGMKMYDNTDSNMLDDLRQTSRRPAPLTGRTDMLFLPSHGGTPSTVREGRNLLQDMMLVLHLEMELRRRAIDRFAHQSEITITNPNQRAARDHHVTEVLAIQEQMQEITGFLNILFSIPPGQQPQSQSQPSRSAGMNSFPGPSAHDDSSSSSDSDDSSITVVDETRSARAIMNSRRLSRDAPDPRQQRLLLHGREARDVTTANVSSQASDHTTPSLPTDTRATVQRGNDAASRYGPASRTEFENETYPRLAGGVRRNNDLHPEQADTRNTSNSASGDNEAPFVTRALSRLTVDRDELNERGDSGLLTSAGSNSGGSSLRASSTFQRALAESSRQSLSSFENATNASIDSTLSGSRVSPLPPHRPGPIGPIETAADSGTGSGWPETTTRLPVTGRRRSVFSPEPTVPIDAGNNRSIDANTSSERPMTSSRNLGARGTLAMTPHQRPIGTHAQTLPLPPIIRNSPRTPSPIPQMQILMPAPPTNTPEHRAQPPIRLLRRPGTGNRTTTDQGNQQQAATRQPASDTGRRINTQRPSPSSQRQVTNTQRPTNTQRNTNTQRPTNTQRNTNTQRRATNTQRSVLNAQLRPALAGEQHLSPETPIAARPRTGYRNRPTNSQQQSSTNQTRSQRAEPTTGGNRAESIPGPSQPSGTGRLLNRARRRSEIQIQIQKNMEQPE